MSFSKAAREAAAWNKRHPIGTVVRYWAMLKRGDPTGTAPTVGLAYDHCGSAVVRIDKGSGTDLIAITHVEAAS